MLRLGQDNLTFRQSFGSCSIEGFFLLTPLPLSLSLSPPPPHPLYLMKLETTSKFMVSLLFRHTLVKQSFYDIPKFKDSWESEQF